MLNRNNSRLLRFSLLVALVLSALSLLPGLPGLPVQAAQAQGTSQTFPETGKTVSDGFLTYWQTHGGLAQQGYPISNEMSETSEVDGKVYTVQYFERAEFEYHPEFAPPNNILLSLLGAIQYKAKYANGAPAQTPNTESGSVLFSETGKHVGARFYAYWTSHGGLTQQGYPISEEFTEVSPLDGKPYLVQYFERAVFELHPEYSFPNDVLLSQLGTFKYNAQYGSVTLQAQNGSYSGQLQNGKPEGQGTFIWNNGDQYTGEWHNGLMNGQGVLQYAGIGTYQGALVDDKRSGQGTMTWLDGDKYVGAWVNDLMEGQGTYSFASGASYVGQWVGGKMQGQGTYRFADGTTVTGQWYDNSYVGS